MTMKCRLSGKTVTWIPRDTWVHGDLVTCLCGATVRFRVRETDHPGHARILTHNATNPDFWSEER